jgi:acyl dehydratase
MRAQIYYQDVEVGTEIPTLIKHPTTRQLVKWATASGDYYQIHYDKDFAQSMGLPGVIVHGWLTLSFLGQLMTDWIGEEGALRKLGCTYRNMNFPGEDIICKGRVTRKYIKDGEHRVECEIWAENPRGEKTASGTAVVVLPSRE